MALHNRMERIFAGSVSAPLGERIPRIDGAQKVAGDAGFGADVGMPRMLSGRMLLSPHPHALIKNIDTRRARALIGVKAIVTDEDTAQVRLG